MKIKYLSFESQQINTMFLNRIDRPVLEPLLKEAIEKSISFRADMLDCSKSLRRQPADELPADVFDMAFADPSSFWIMILRTGYGEPYWEISARFDAGPKDYFIWIDLAEEEGDKLIEKYEIRKRCLS